MVAQPNYRAMPDEQLYSNDHIFWEESQKQALFSERKRREEAKQLEEERIAQERAAKITAIKNTIRYSEKLAGEICERVSTGEFLINICLDEHMPTIRGATQWLREHHDFQALYRQAIEDRLNIFEDEVVTIPDDGSKDYKIVIKRGKPVRVADPEQISRSKLRVDVRLRHLKAYRPHKWGEVSTLNVKDDSNNSIDDMSLDDLEKKIAEFEIKDRILRTA